MIKLYHGSYTKVEAPLVDVGRRNLDFGRGFYLTRLQLQAEKWALVVGSRHYDTDEGVVTEYGFNDEAFAKYKVLAFPEYDVGWLNFVVANRHGEDVVQGYDAIEGGVANDQVIDTVEDYEMGRISAQMAFDQLRYKKPNHQLCIRNQEVVNQCLVYLNSYIVKGED